MRQSSQQVLKGAGWLSLAALLMGAGAKPATPVPHADESKVMAASPQKMSANESKKGFSGLVVYTDDKSPKNHYVASGWMGDYNGIKMDTNSQDNPQSGNSCIKFVYKPSSPNAVRWAGVFWQDPPNNWGDKDGGFDLTGANKLTFWARGTKGGEMIKEFKVGGIKGNFADSDEISIGPITLESSWKQYSINLKGRDLSAISGGFCWATDLDSNPNGLTFYLDNIQFE